MAQIRVRIYGNAITRVVTPAKAGDQRILRRLDSGLRRNDEPNTSLEFRHRALSINLHKGHLGHSSLSRSMQAMWLRYGQGRDGPRTSLVQGLRSTGAGVNAGKDRPQ